MKWENCGGGKITTPLKMQKLQKIASLNEIGSFHKWCCTVKNRNFFLNEYKFFPLKNCTLIELQLMNNNGARKA